VNVQTEIKKMIKPSKILSVTLAVAMAATSAPWSYAAGPVAGPAFVQTFTPPSRLGYVVNSYQGTSKQPIVIIQDLHANFGVQQKIVGLLKAFQKNSIPSSSPMVVGAEGMTGPVDVSYVRGQEPTVRHLASTALLKEAEIAAAQHFAINSEKDVVLMGIENNEDYALHLRLVRASVRARITLAEKVQSARHSFELVKEKAPASLKKIWNAEESYLKGEIGLDRLAKVLHLPAINSYEEVERLLLQRKTELARNLGKDAVFYENLVNADHYLSLMARLFRQQMTLEEVQYVARHMDEALTVVMAVLPGENAQEWKEAIRTAIDYYAIALMRDRPLAENALKLSEQHTDAPVFLIAGGFHAAGIEKELMAKNMSFVTVAPVVENHTLKDEMLYLNRILGVRADISQIAQDVQTKPWAQFLPAESANTGSKPDSTTKGAVDAARGEDNKGNKTPTPFDVKNLANPSNSHAAGTVAALQDVIREAFAVAPGFVGLEPGQIAYAVSHGKLSPNMSVEFGNTASGQGQDWISSVQSDANSTKVVVNEKSVTALQLVYELAIQDGNTAAQASERVRNAALALALSETAVLATASNGVFDESTAMAVRFGFFNLMGRAGEQAMSDFAAVLASDVATDMAKAVGEFNQASVGMRDSMVRDLVERIMNTAQAAYKNKELFKLAINSDAVKNLYSDKWRAQAQAQGAALAAQVRGIGGASAAAVSDTLVRLGIKDQQLKLSQAKIAEIYGSQA